MAGAASKPVKRLGSLSHEPPKRAAEYILRRSLQEQVNMALRILCLEKHEELLLGMSHPSGICIIYRFHVQPVNEPEHRRIGFHFFGQIHG